MDGLQSQTLAISRPMSAMLDVARLTILIVWTMFPLVKRCAVV
jgi:hypothetical protein